MILFYRAEEGFSCFSLERWVAGSLPQGQHPLLLFQELVAAVLRSRKGHPRAYVTLYTRKWNLSKSNRGGFLRCRIGNDVATAGFPRTKIAAAARSHRRID
jgi:hypothetical protein